MRGVMHRPAREAEPGEPGAGGGVNQGQGSALDPPRGSAPSIPAKGGALGEETTGDLARFAKESDFVLAIDPIDGTKQYRDRTGNGYSVMLHLRNRETVRYSLVYIPESGANGTWVEVRDGAVFCGPDDPSQPAADVLRRFLRVDPQLVPHSNRIYVVGFQSHDADRGRDLAAAGLEACTSDTIGGCVYEMRLRGQLAVR